MQVIMGGMVKLQLKLTPDEARILLILLESECVNTMDEARRNTAGQLAPYLRHRIARLWGPCELPEPARWRDRVDAVTAEQWANATIVPAE